ncbi:MAG TPA: transglycosylase SLT domain-containing protein [Solirubrobacteraceae bacterium]|nr:transglycosylase SLT domain-containing protein [Solirubrobacteraceae bacterium]
MTGERGQASVLLLGALLAVLAGGLVLAALARGVGEHASHQRAADLAALAGARAMYGSYDRLFEPAFVGGRPNPRHLGVAAYRALGQRAAVETARRNGASDVRVDFPDRDSFAPVRIAVTVLDPIDVGGPAAPPRDDGRASVATGRAGAAATPRDDGRAVAATGRAAAAASRPGDRRAVVATARAEAELAPPATLAAAGAGAGEYRGPLAHRQGKPMRPDVALAFDRMERAARADGVSLVIASAFRSNAEQAALFDRRPDPRWVAPPGRSLHRLGTELDLGPTAAYGWLAANARRFGFVQRYSWEPWHYGYVRSAGSRSVGFGPPDGANGMPSFVPPRFAPAIGRAAQRWNVGAALLAAQLYAESNFNPFAHSPAGAQGIAQFMPGTARAYGLANPYDAAAAIDAQAHLMHDLLAQFGSVPLALAAYNAGAGGVARCGCIPPYPETRGYVTRILGLLGGAGEASASGGLTVRLVR